MKKLTAIILAAAMVFALAACGDSNVNLDSGTVAPTGEVEGTETSAVEYNWKMGSPFNEGSSNDEACKIFISKLEELSGGKIKVDFFPGNTLGDSAELEEGLAHGTATFVYESVASLASWSDLANIDAYPYLYSSLDHFLKVWNSEIGESIREAVGQEGGFKMFGTLYRGARVVTGNKRIETVDDVKGFKIRTPNTAIYVDTWNYLGAMSTPMAGSDIFTGIQQGTVEGQENPIIDSYNLGLYDVCDYLIRTNHVYSQCTFIMDRAYYESLPAEVQGWIAEAAEAAAEYKNTVTPQEEEEYLQKWIDNGTEVIDVDVQQFMDAMAGFGEQYYPQFSEYIDQILAAA